MTSYDAVRVYFEPSIQPLKVRENLDHLKVNKEKEIKGREILDYISFSSTTTQPSDPANTSVDKKPENAAQSVNHLSIYSVSLFLLLLLESSFLVE